MHLLSLSPKSTRDQEDSFDNPRISPDDAFEFDDGVPF
ncbi:MAG: hypothetical protein CM15mP32_1460 [Flavobacteriaceae bacterium]|nr:MAG: hypothetical protein CM15mP32_1460 [Flavobacteriaceae bacterium]